MDGRLLRLFALVATVLLVPGTALYGAESRELILVAGQSNAVGYDAYATDLPPDPADQEVLFWWRCGDPPPDEHDSTSHRKWAHLQPQPRGEPIPRNSHERGEPVFGLKRQYGNFGKPVGGFGPEIGLARELVATQHKSLAILKVAFSGTGMRTDWNPSDTGEGGACYRALVSETKAAMAAAAAKGIGMRLRALVWLQGESDANARDAPNYESALEAMLVALRNDLGAPRLFALLSVNPRFGNDKNPFIRTIIEAQEAIAAKDKRCDYVDCTGAETLLPSRTHFTAAGTLDVGRRFARALLKLESATKTK